MAAWRRPWRPCRSNTRRTWNNWRTGIIFTARNSASYRYCPMFNCCLSCVSDWRVSTKLSGTKSTKCTRRRQTNVMYWWRSRSEDTLTLFFPNTDLNCKLQITLISEWLQMDLLPQCSLFHNRVDSWFVTCKMFFFVCPKCLIGQLWFRQLKLVSARIWNAYRYRVLTLALVVSFPSFRWRNWRANRKLRRRIKKSATAELWGLSKCSMRLPLEVRTVQTDIELLEQSVTSRSHIPFKQTVPEFWPLFNDFYF